MSTIPLHCVYYDLYFPSSFLNSSSSMTIKMVFYSSYKQSSLKQYKWPVSLYPIVSAAVQNLRGMVITRGNIITRSSGNVKTHPRNLQKCTSIICNTCISKVWHLVQFLWFFKLNQQSFSYLYRSIRKTTHPNLIDHSKFYFTWKPLLYCY